jgi:ATP adenylyltransferase
MERLYAPWRSSYLKGDDDRCPFCVAATTKNDEESLVIARREHAIIMLNRYPYNAGHLLIVPHDHTGDPNELPPEVRAALMEAAIEGLNLLKKVLKCEGTNIGFNFGKVSGGSIPDHLHLHVVPRWQGDASFLTTIADTKLVSFDLNEIFRKLRAHR